jgi:hypothetical protein
VLEEQLVLPVAQPAHGLSIRWVGGLSFGDLDGARGKEAPHAGEARLAVHKAAVVVELERHERLTRPIRAFVQVVIEQTLPRRGVD